MSDINTGRIISKESKGDLQAGTDLGKDSFGHQITGLTGTSLEDRSGQKKYTGTFDVQGIEKPVAGQLTLAADGRFVRFDASGGTKEERDKINRSMNDTTDTDNSGKRVDKGDRINTIPVIEKTVTPDGQVLEQYKDKKGRVLAWDKTSGSKTPAAAWSDSIEGSGYMAADAANAPTTPARERINTANAVNLAQAMGARVSQKGIEMNSIQSSASLGLEKFKIGASMGANRQNMEQKNYDVSYQAIREIQTRYDNDAVKTGKYDQKGMTAELAYLAKSVDIIKKQDYGINKAVVESGNVMNEMKITEDGTPPI